MFTTKHTHISGWPDVPVVAWKQVGRPGPKKKARMSRTRSDFLTRCNSEGATQSDDEDDEYYIPAHSHTLPPSLSPPCAHSEADCHSDSEMVKYRISGGFMTSKHSGCLPLNPLLRWTWPKRQGRGLLTLLTPLSSYCLLLTCCWTVWLRAVSPPHSNRPSLRLGWSEWPCTSLWWLLVWNSAHAESSKLSLLDFSPLFISQKYICLSRDGSTFWSLFLYFPFPSLVPYRTLTIIFNMYWFFEMR